MTRRHRVAFAVAAVLGVAALVVVLVIVGVIGDGRATSATVTPCDVAVDAAGNLYIADFYQRIRKVTPDGEITTIVGGECTNDDIDSISHVTVDGEGNALFSDGDLLCRVAVDGTITTVAGKMSPAPTSGLTPPLCPGRFGKRRGRATAIEVCPDDVVVDAAGNTYFVDVLDDHPHAHVRMVTAAGDMSTLDLTRSGVDPYALAIDDEGNLFVADHAGRQVLKVDADRTLTVVAGSGMPGKAGYGGLAVDAAIDPIALAVDTDGNLYIVDDLDHRVRKVSPDGIISIVAGNGSLAFSGDGGPALSAAINPRAIAVDRAGNLYIADASDRVLKVSPDGIVSTVAGDGSSKRPPVD